MPALTRYAAPAAFLVAVTVAILLIRPALGDDEAAAPAATTAPARTVAPPLVLPRRTTTAAPAAPGRFHEIRAGDTLGTVADRYETSVEALVDLNPGIDPVGLQVGQRVRVE